MTYVIPQASQRAGIHLQPSAPSPVPEFQVQDCVGPEHRPIHAMARTTFQQPGAKHCKSEVLSHD
jgi:hypothetical protein